MLDITYQPDLLTLCHFSTSNFGEWVLHQQFRNKRGGPIFPSSHSSWKEVEISEAFQGNTGFRDPTVSTEPWGKNRSSKPTKSTEGDQMSTNWWQIFQKNSWQINHNDRTNMGLNLSSNISLCIFRKHPHRPNKAMRKDNWWLAHRRWDVGEFGDRRLTAVPWKEFFFSQEKNIHETWNKTLTEQVAEMFFCWEEKERWRSWIKAMQKSNMRWQVSLLKDPWTGGKWGQEKHNTRMI